MSDERPCGEADDGVWRHPHLKFMRMCVVSNALTSIQIFIYFLSCYGSVFPLVPWFPGCDLWNANCLLAHRFHLACRGSSKKLWWARKDVEDGLRSQKFVTDWRLCPKQMRMSRALLMPLCGSSSTKCGAKYELLWCRPDRCCGCSLWSFGDLGFLHSLCFLGAIMKMTKEEW